MAASRAFNRERSQRLAKSARPVSPIPAAAVYDQVMINAGRRVIMVKLAPSDILRTLGALVADVTA